MSQNPFEAMEAIGDRVDDYLLENPVNFPSVMTGALITLGVGDLLLVAPRGDDHYNVQKQIYALQETSGVSHAAEIKALHAKDPGLPSVGEAIGIETGLAVSGIALGILLAKGARAALKAAGISFVRGSSHVHNG